MSIRVGTIGVASAYLLSAFTAMAATLDVGPYIQRGTPSGFCVKWHTNVDDSSLLEYGDAHDNLTDSVSAVGPTQNHEICITGLAANTTYFYAVGPIGGPRLAGADVDHYFKTFPVVDSEDHVRFAFLSDTHNADGDFLTLLSVLSDYNALQEIDLIILGGDNAGNSGTAAEHEVLLNAMSDWTRNTLVVATPGNHDNVSSNCLPSEICVGGPCFYDYWALYDDAQAGGTSSGHESYYDFIRGNVHFLTTDIHGCGSAGAHYTWFSTAVAASASEWRVYWQHYPPYAKCAEDSDNLGGYPRGFRETWLHIYDDNGGDIQLGGHVHCYERSFFVDGHYGLSTTFKKSLHAVQPGNGGLCGLHYTKVGGGPVGNSGVVYATVSSWTMSTTGLELPTHPVFFKTLKVNPITDPGQAHAMIFDIEGKKLSAFTVTANHEIIDRFYITKSAP